MHVWFIIPQAVVIDLGNHDTVLLSGPKLTWPSFRFAIFPDAMTWEWKYEPGISFVYSW